MIARFGRAAAVALLLVSVPALAGIEEHSPEPNPDMDLYGGFTRVKSFEGLNFGKSDDAGNGGAQRGFPKDALVPAVATDLQLQWMFAHVGILFEPGSLLPATDDMAHTPPPHVRPERRGDEAITLDRPSAESDQPADLATAASALTESDEAGAQAAGCATSPTPARGLSALLFATLVAMRRRVLAAR
ncbi:MAG: hypothetical protein AMXMBFR64_51080 [Myxococcales bacterium]